MALVEMLTSIPEMIEAATSRNDDDFYDRLSSRYTVFQLIFFALLVTAGQIINDPITCWVPAHFHGSWEAYTNSYCWVRNTYHVPWLNDIPLAPENIRSDLEDYRMDGGPERGSHTVTYYQWVPIILLIQAGLFFIPCAIWRTFNHKTGIDVNMIIETAEAVQVELEEPVRQKILGMLTRMTHRFLNYSRKPDEGRCCQRCSVGFSLTQACCCGRRQGNYMTVLYIIIKLISLVNALAQFFLLDLFLGDAGFRTYGIRVIQAMGNGRDWTQLASFPRVTFCDVVVRRLGNSHRYTVQCTLIMNLLNEKIFFYLWWWLLFVCVATAFSLIRWIVKFIFQKDRYLYLKKHLKEHDQRLGASNHSKECFRKFVFEYLRQDGHLVLKLVDLNTNKVTLVDLLGALWDNFRRNPQTVEAFKLEEGKDHPADEDLNRLQNHAT